MIAISQEFETEMKLSNESIVISGISGVYPQARSVKDLSDILYNKVNPITEATHWQFKHPEATKFSGRAPYLNYFDAQFFRVHGRLSNSMDPMSRKVLEHTYQAVYDAGMSPEHLKGKNVGVYIGTSFSESESTGFYNNIMKTSLGIIGSSKAMFANRISYWLHVKGPSVAIEGSCCSSAIALEQAYLAIKSGVCDAAIVGTCHICYLPHSSVHYGRATKMSPDGKTRSFDQSADGFTKSDAANVLFLQKASDALRVYAQLIHVKTEFTLKPKELSCIQPFGFYREPETSAEFLNNFYNEIHIFPNEVEYVEAFGSAIPEADKAELDAFDQVFCRSRSTPLLVGSVMSNVGYTEAATGLTAITKVLLAYETGLLASNLHFKNQHQDISALREGRMHIVKDHYRFNRTYAAINGLSFNGVNSHVLLHGHHNMKDPARYTSGIPHLVTISSRTESGVKNIFEHLKSSPVDPEELALLHNIHSTSISGHLGRGYIVLDTKGQQTVSHVEHTEHFDGAKRPLWFVYSGMGSQWPGMGSQLMRIPTFAAAMERCRRVLEPEGIDIINIITATDKTIFDNIVNSFVGIAAIQIGLTDVLYELGLIPDNIIGHSVGELGCAYADGCMSAEEMVLSAYSRGLISLKTPLIRGSMAAVGLGYQEISKLCPPEIEVACHNGPDSSTISGPADIMGVFVSYLKNTGIFAKEVACSNIAYHSRYISGAGPGLREYLSNIIKYPKARSDRWVSTSVPRDKWNEPAAKYSSAEYHTNNLLNPVLFEETSSLIPPNAVLVEVAPHGLMQAILKRSLFSSCQNIPLTKRGHPDNVIFLLNAIGKLYMEGYSPKVQFLYPKIEFPVSTGTSMLSHLVEWMYTDAWDMPFYSVIDKKHAAACEYLISIHDVEHNYLQGNRIRGKQLFPYAGVFVAVWDTLAMTLCEKKKFSVRFHDIHLYSQPVLHDQRLLRLKVALQRATGQFEVSNEYSKIASGFISSKLLTEDTKSFVKYYGEGNKPMELEKSDLYELLSERDYSYSGDFRSIHNANILLTEALIEWNNNWVTLIDGMLQLNALRESHDGVSIPKFIRKLVINTNEHYNNKILKDDGKSFMKVDIVKTHDFTRCGGVFIQNIRFHNLPKYHIKQLRFFAPSLHTFDEVDHEMSIVNKDFSKIEDATLEIKSVGDVNSLHWVTNIDDKRQTNVLNNNGIWVKVHYAGLNVSDLKIATAMVTFTSKDNNFGMEFSGITKKGDRVMGLLSGGACSTCVFAQPDLLWPVPSYWNLEDAATVPFAYTLAFYCLAIKVDLQPNISILVHGGAGALGQAVISIALAHKCQVFTTVSSNSKKSLLCKIYPDLNEKNIGNSRDQSFGDMVLSATNGKGCDIVISNVRKELKNISLKCNSFNGFTFDVSQILNSENYNYGMYSMTKERSYVAIDFSTIFDFENFGERQMLQSLMSEGISRGYVRPLTRATFPADKAPCAFRFIVDSHRHGRVLLQIKDTLIKTHPRILCTSNHCQVLVGDRSKLVVQVAERLIRRGARRIYYHVPVLTSFDRFKFATWKKLGVDVKVSSNILSCTNTVKSLIIDAEKFGTIESIFIFLLENNHRERKHEKLSSLVEKIDSASRNLCPDLKYFAVITNDQHEIGSSVCDLRIKDGFPATLLNISSFEKETSNDRRSIDPIVLDALESSLNNLKPVLTSDQYVENLPSLLQQIELILDIKLSDTDVSVTLRELGVNDTQCQIIIAFLRDTHNICLTEDEVSRLTKNRINELEQFITEPDFKDVKGLGNFFSNVDQNELLANAEIIPMSTWAHEVISTDDDFDVSHTYLCIVPGMEGLHGRFRNLCERLKIPALVLQPGLDSPHETITEMAARFAKILFNKIRVEDNFYLLGYEMGVLVVLEIAEILEKQGLKGTIFWIGCTPDDLKYIVNKQLKDFETDDRLQNAIVKHVYKMVMKEDCAVIENALNNVPTWIEKVEVCVRRTLGRVALSAQYVAALMEVMLARIKQIRRYSCSVRQLRSKIILIRTSSASPLTEIEIQKYSQEPLAVHDLKTQLPYATQDMLCSAIINKYLSAELLDAFEKKNLCEVYIMNSSTRFAVL